MEGFGAQRLKQFIDYLRFQGKIFNARDFSERIHKSNTFVSDLLSGRRDISSKTAQAIAAGFPEMNVRWLLDPECTEMLVTSGSTHISNAGNVNNGRDQLIGAADDYRTLCETVARQQEFIDRLLGIIEKMQVK